MKTQITVIINVETDVPMTADEIFTEFGSHNFIGLMTRPIVEDIKRQIGDQIHAQHSILGDAEQYWAAEMKFRAMFDYESGEGYTPSKRFDREEAQQLLARMRELLAKHSVSFSDLFNGFHQEIAGYIS